MNKGSIVERFCSDLIAKSRDINGLLWQWTEWGWRNEEGRWHDDPSMSLPLAVFVNSHWVADAVNCCSISYLSSSSSKNLGFFRVCQNSLISQALGQCHLLDRLFWCHVTTRTKAMCWNVTVNVETRLLAKLQLHKRTGLHPTQSVNIKVSTQFTLCHCYR